VKADPNDLSVECDYDWKHADSRLCEVNVSLNVDTDEEAEALLLAGDDKIGDECGNRYKAVNVMKINGQNPGDVDDYVGLVTEACLAHLRANPGTREFKIDGDMM